MSVSTKSYGLREQNRRFISALGEQAYVFELKPHVVE